MASKSKYENWKSWRIRQRLKGNKYRTIRISTETDWSLKKLAAEKKVSVTELVLTYIEWGLENDRGNSNVDEGEKS